MSDDFLSDFDSSVATASATTASTKATQLGSYQPAPVYLKDPVTGENVMFRCSSTKMYSDNRGHQLIIIKAREIAQSGAFELDRGEQVVTLKNGAVVKLYGTKKDEVISDDQLTEL